MAVPNAIAASRHPAEAVLPIVTEQRMVSASLVAKFFLALAEDEDLISNRKLQKLLYYAQGFHLAMYGTPLFPEEVRRWTHGPAVPAVWDEYESYDLGAIPPPSIDFDDYTPRETELIKHIYCAYGQFSDWKLEVMSRREPPYADTPRSGVISHRRMADYFVRELEDDVDGPRSGSDLPQLR